MMVDISDAAVNRGLSTVGGSLERLVKKEKMSAADREATLKRITGTTDRAKLADCDLVIEAATENEELKVKILKDLCATLSPRTLVATNTSSISITKLAAATDRPDRFIGMHFFNPVPVMALLELIRGLQTSDDTHAKALDFAQRVGKVAITAKEQSGLRGQPHPLPDDQRGDLRPPGGDRDGGRDRRRHEARLQPSDRAAGARRSRRARHHVVGDGGLLQRLQRPQIPSGPLAEGNGRCRPSRPQDRAGFLHLRRLMTGVGGGAFEPRRPSRNLRCDKDAARN
ncbi:ribosomal protein S8E [Bradyrhizobium diazoefficiens]